MKYLVIGSEGPGFASPQEAVNILESIVIPSFDALIQLEKQGKILAGGLPVGDRAFVFIMEAASNAEVDELLRNLPMWGSLKWKVTALQSIEGRATKERDVIQKIKGLKS